MAKVGRMMNKSQNELLKTVLLLALPASGKSEVRKFLASLTPDQCQEEFHLGPTIQLDDFPYVHIMRRIDEELASLQKERVFFVQGDQPFKNGKDWGTLIELINEDYEDLILQKTYNPTSSSRHVFERFERASRSVGIEPRLSLLDDSTLNTISKALETETRALLNEKNNISSQDLEGKTVVIEFARGGPHGSQLPLPAPYGYQHSLSLLSGQILSNARILYVWVTPEESRRKNEARANPLDPGSILHHGVPHEVMMREYGCDDMDYLESHSGKANAIQIDSHGRSYTLPIARFDNRTDKTSFIREDQALWKESDVQALHDGLKNALKTLAHY